MSDLYENRRFTIFESSELHLINFEEVHETSIDTVRKSIDGLKTFVKYDLLAPSCLQNLTTIVGEYTYEEMLQILSSPEWTSLDLEG